MTENERQPINEVLAGRSSTHSTKAGRPSKHFVLIKALDNNDLPTWVYRTTHQLNREELLGALTVQTGLLKRELLEE